MPTNPYQPPTADVSSGDKLRRGSLGWAWFFWIMSGLTVMAYAGMLMTSTFDLAWYDSLDTAISLLSLAGIYGLAYAKPIGQNTMWRIVFWVYLAWSVAIGWIIPFGFGLPVYGYAPALDWAVLIDVILIGAFVLGLYLYAYRREAIWAK